MGDIEQMPEQEGQIEQLTYLPLPILNIETRVISLINSETQQPESFVQILYKDIGGEKAMWLPAEAAIPFGEEICRLGAVARTGMKVPRTPKPGLWTPA